MPNLELDFLYTSVINYAMQQNHVSVVKKIGISNNGNADFENMLVQITSEPDFAVVWTQRISALKAGDTIEIAIVDLKIKANFLAELTERMAGSFCITVTANEIILYRENYSVDILAYDQWNGITILPEILAAFITPNHPEIPIIIRRAAAILEKWTGSPSFNEYQSNNPDRVRKQMAAIYEAIAEKQIIYCSVPASFEETGQRIRLCNTIIDHKMGNCLDLSLLYAACLEAVGIHPFIIIIKGHAFTGGWLINESFADSVSDDVSLLTKRAADGINELVLVEATCMNAGNQASFDDAVKSANGHLLNNDEFILFVDVKRARFGGIRPLPLRIKTASGWEIIEEEIIERNNESPEALFIGNKLMTVAKIDASKQALWERKLLDLTLRNTLLNLRITKSAIQFIAVNLSQLEDVLADGGELQILPKPTDWDNPLRSTGIYQAVNYSDPINDLVKHEFLQKRLRAYLSENELADSVSHLYRSSKTAMDENGANTLYIALGLLKWYETPASEKPRYAPILLLPVEIVKKSAQKGFVIRGREEETMMNITLLEMLRQDFGIGIGGLETLPKDDSGIDVKAVFSIIRQSIMQQSRWDVEEQAFLGTFSFSKFILWNDIHNNTENLYKNKIVASLVSGKLEWETDAENLAKENFDETIHPLDIALPISTDSSQLEAIISAAKGNSFVLHGPPGTGKSQTITNIIANALYAGKKVLFVAAKKAALEVVESRLESIGIGAFCLEIHSNKSKKSAVLEQLKKATEVTRKQAPENFKAESDRLFALRAELSGYVEALHKKHHFGLSLFDLFGKYAQNSTLVGAITFDTATLETLTPNKLAQLGDIVEELQAICIICKPYNHPLQAITTSLYTQPLKQEARLLIEDYKRLLSSYNAMAVATCATLKVDPTFTTRAQTEALLQVVKLVLQLPDMPASLFNIDNVEQTLTQAISVAEHGNKRDILRYDLLEKFNNNILVFLAEQALRDWNIASRKWFLPRFFKQAAIAKSLKKISLNGNVDKEAITTILQTIIDLQKEQKLLDEATFLPSLLGFLYNNGNCNWNGLILICHTIIKINKLVLGLIGIDKIKAWRNALANQLSEGVTTFVTSNSKNLETFTILSNDILLKENSLKNLLAIDFETLEKANAHWVDDAIANATKWLDNIDDLRDWCNWQQVKAKAINAGLLPVITAIEAGKVNSDVIVKHFEKGMYRSCAEFIINSQSQLASFNGKLFEDKIKRFKEVSSYFEKLTKDELYARLAAKIPSFTQEASQSSEIAILQKNIRNNGRATSIRKIFDAIPNLLPRLTPCMLMSSISVAQYFDTNSVKFDLVIFDEASQMPTCEAVGAIARAKNVIIVGDPKQMPPTSFFSTNNIDDDNIGNEDLESILDDCLALSMPSKHLLWHYRSRHESLIAFSNAKYYDNKLLTFPSIDDITSKVTHVPVNGFYDKGKTRQNYAEAKAIVNEVVMRLSNPILAKKSIGIITFSVVQQILIEDLLNDVFKAKPNIEKIAIEATEPLFIKNLENVQGDERDVILFSVGYGPDKDGKVGLNFGPINREGGWRRLNVAVSRARYEMKVFSTLHSDQIDLKRTASEGVAGLKSFLAYAEKGKIALPKRIANGLTSNKAFEKLLATQIQAKGYDVHVNIGCSDFRIDIGVVDVEDPSKYLLGILCDGDNYYAANTVRDREIVQLDVLASLGWVIHKVWSTEWWENPVKVIDEVTQAINQAKENKHNTITEVGDNETQALETEYLANAASSVVVAKATVYYEICNLEVMEATSSDDFLQYFNQFKLQNQIRNILAIEAPISKDLLCRRLLNVWNISRMGTRVAAHLDSIFADMKIEQTQHGKSIFFWNYGQLPSTYFIYRVAASELQKREADHLPPEEIANAIKDILSSQLSLSKSDLVKETAKLFGYARIGINVENAVLLGLHVATQNGYAIEDNERIILMTIVVDK